MGESTVNVIPIPEDVLSLAWWMKYHKQQMMS
jgi:hypothetical protein